MGSARLRRPHLAIAAIATIAALGADCPLAAEQNPPHRYEISGTGSLSVDAPLQQAGALRLKAMLSRATAHFGPVTQADARFALSGALAAASLVCFNDTIFRDDYDADGF